MNKDIIVNPENTRSLRKGKTDIPVFQSSEELTGIEPYVLHLDDTRLPWADRPKIMVPEHVNTDFVMGDWYGYEGPKTWNELPYNRVVWSRNFEEFKHVINALGVPQKISFDHDLGMGKDGHDAAKWLVKNRILPKEFAVHSANISGAKQIRGLMENAKEDQSQYPEEWNNDVILSYE